MYHRYMYNKLYISVYKVNQIIGHDAILWSVLTMKFYCIYYKVNYFIREKYVLYVLIWKVETLRTFCAAHIYIFY